MTLNETNSEIAKLFTELEDQLPRTTKLEEEYYKKYYDFLLRSHLPSAEKREAEAREMLAMDGITDKYQDAKLKLKTLYLRKEFLFEIAKNLRILEAHED